MLGKVGDGAVLAHCWGTEEGAVKTHFGRDWTGNSEEGLCLKEKGNKEPAK